MRANGVAASSIRIAGSQPQRPRPDARSNATTPAMRANQLRYPSRTVVLSALASADQCLIATNAVEQLEPSADWDGNATLWPTPTTPAIPPESRGQSGAMNPPASQYQRNDMGHPEGRHTPSDRWRRPKWSTRIRWRRLGMVPLYSDEPYKHKEKRRPSRLHTIPIAADGSAWKRRTGGALRRWHLVQRPAPAVWSPSCLLFPPSGS